MIIVVIHDHDGRLARPFSVSTKAFIRHPPYGDHSRPTKLDQFVFLRKKKTGNRVEWEVEPDLTVHYGQRCHELRIIRLRLRYREHLCQILRLVDGHQARMLA